MMSPGTISVAGMLRRSPSANDRGVGGRHRAQGRDRRLGPRLLDVAHGGVEQDDREDGDRLVRQRRVALVGPQAGRDGGGDEQQDDEHILELRQEPAPRGNRLLGRQLVAPVLLESRLRLTVAETALQVGPERRDDLVDALAVRAARVRLLRYARRSDDCCSM